MLSFARACWIWQVLIVASYMNLINPLLPRTQLEREHNQLVEVVVFKLSLPSLEQCAID